MPRNKIRNKVNFKSNDINIKFILNKYVYITLFRIYV